MGDILQLKITLLETEPQIWRQLLVDKKVTFFRLHHIIQLAMGWSNAHLFEFKVGKSRIGMLYDGIEDYGSEESKLINALTLPIDRMVKSKGKIFYYEYDFGDSWRHEILVEEIFSNQKIINIAVCTNGQLHCPPEDCGGVYGFYQLLEILNDKEHPEYKDAKILVGRKFRPDKFDLISVNKKLAKLDKYISL